MAEYTSKEMALAAIEALEDNDDVASDSSDDIVFPSFDDLPTVSSLASNNSINVSTEGNSDSFWDKGSGFEFPDLNSWEDK